jgi:hypothetical protein
VPLIEPFGPPRDCALRADITKRALPELGLMSGTLRRLRHAARPKGSVPRRDDILLAVNLRGCSTAQQCGRQLVLREGDALPAMCEVTALAITRQTPVRFIGFRVPREVIAHALL